MKIVVGNIQTAEGRAAIERALTVGRLLGADVHFVDYVPLPKDDESAGEYEQIREDLLAKLRETIAKTDSGSIEVRAHVPDGATRLSDAILSVAQGERANLIVIGTRKRSRVGKLVLGSMAQEVLLESDCDVLSVKVAQGSSTSST